MDILKLIVGKLVEVFKISQKVSETGVNPPPEIVPIEDRVKVPIIVDRQVRQKYQRGWVNKPREASLPVTEFVVHGTAGGTDVNAFLRWMMNGERAAEYLKGIALFHYFIGRGGEIVEIIDPQFWVWHSSSGRHDKQTIGVELINPSKINDAVYTDAQYTALVALIVHETLPAYPALTRIVSHNVNQQTYSPSYGGKQCPGKGFDWKRFATLLQKAGVKIKNQGFEVIELDR